jgi:cation transport regulator ChaC
MVLGSYYPRWMNVRVDTHFGAHGNARPAEGGAGHGNAQIAAHGDTTPVGSTDHQRVERASRDATPRSLVALAFVVDRKHAQYTGPLSLDDQVRVIASASGTFGSSADYLERARISLITHGIVDAYLETLAAGVARGRGEEAPALATSRRAGRRRR